MADIVRGKGQAHGGVGWHGLAWVTPLEQIQIKDYAKQFMIQQPVYKVGVVFDEDSRNVKEWIVEESL